VFFLELDRCDISKRMLVEWHIVSTGILRTPYCFEHDKGGIYDSQPHLDVGRKEGSSAGAGTSRSKSY
jgi:hypothetical protein